MVLLKNVLMLTVRCLIMHVLPYQISILRVKVDVPHRKTPFAAGMTNIGALKITHAMRPKDYVFAVNVVLMDKVTARVIPVAQKRINILGKRSVPVDVVPFLMGSVVAMAFHVVLQTSLNVT